MMDKYDMTDNFNYEENLMIELFDLKNTNELDLGLKYSDLDVLESWWQLTEHHVGSQAVREIPQEKWETLLNKFSIIYGDESERHVSAREILDFWFSDGEVA